MAIEFAKLVDKVRSQKAVAQIDEELDFYSYSRRECAEVEIGGVKVGGGNAPAVAVFNGESPKAEFGFDSSNNCGDFHFEKCSEPEDLKSALARHKVVAAEISAGSLIDFSGIIRNAPKGSVILVPAAPKMGRHAIGEARMLAAKAKKLHLDCPIMLKFDESKCLAPNADEASKLTEASIYLGSLFTDGIGDIASVSISKDAERNAEACLAIMQGARARKSKAEYIACPSCGRTLYNIQETAAKIKERTKHLKGLTIGIMGCIVNGPGEMSDADFGYVGGAPGKINLYKNKECVEIGIPQEEAIEHLIALIKSSGKWVEP